MTWLLVFKRQVMVRERKKDVGGHSGIVFYIAMHQNLLKRQV